MSEEIEYIRDELAKNSRLQVAVTHNIVSVDSPEWSEVPADGTEPDEIQVTQTQDGRFEVRPVGTHGERFDLSADAAVECVEGFLEGNEFY